MGILLVSDLSLYFLALALLGGVLFLLVSLRLRQLDERLERIAARTRRNEEILERLDELPQAWEEFEERQRDPGQHSGEEGGGEGGAGADLQHLRSELLERLGELSSNLAEQLEFLRDEVRAGVREVIPLRPAEADADSFDEPARVAATFLEEEGFERVSILSAAPLGAARSEGVEEGGEGPARFLVEAVREDVVHKGVVTILAGRVADVELRPTYPMFP